MNISRKWLKEFVDITATDKEYDEIMTIAGQKVETTTRMDEDIKNVVVGKVLSCLLYTAGTCRTVMACMSTMQYRQSYSSCSATQFLIAPI